MLTQTGAATRLLNRVYDKGKNHMLIMDCLHMILFYCKAVNLARLERSSASTCCTASDAFFLSMNTNNGLIVLLK
jgi:hypothetical protein